MLHTATNAMIGHLSHMT